MDEPDDNIYTWLATNTIITTSPVVKTKRIGKRKSEDLADLIHKSNYGIQEEAWLGRTSFSSHW